MAELIAEGRQFRTIYADPPWDYQNRVSRGAPRRHYATMTLEEICAEPVAQLAADDAHLHLWTTNGFLEAAFAVLAAWGFCYKSCFVWAKPQLGAGNYWRVSHEFLLLGVRGRLPFADHSQRSWLEAPRTAHSRKPDRIRWLVEQVSPPPYLELYGRQCRPDSNGRSTEIELIACCSDWQHDRFDSIVGSYLEHGARQDRRLWSGMPRSCLELCAIVMVETRQSGSV